ncbi:MAG: metallophosphoesterase [Pseudomonadota bacterium]|nr:metallophosphoesterase [Pseudomonadota bacterium]
MTRADLSRRRSRGLTWSLRIVVAAVLAVCVRGFIWEPSQLVERDQTLVLPGWPASCDGLRLDVVADTHTGSPRNGLDKLDRWVQRLIESDADAVLMAGDYVILSVFLGSYSPAEVIAERLQPLTARKPVYAVLGNHDWWKDGPAVSAAFAAAGVRMVDNRAEAVQLRGCRFWIAGLGDLREGEPDVAGTFAQVGDDAPVIALTHEPDLFPRIPVRAALTVAGHTHGGQIDLWPLRQDPSGFVRGSRWLKWHIVDDGRHLFVTPGIGTSILPMRLGVLPEISRLTLRSEQMPRQDVSRKP